ncbi:Protein NUCLEAR FUSION DEFECTIVE 4 [Linum grandiflorum]
MLFGSLLIMSVNGTSYMFGLYSGQIKSSLGYDQTTLNKLSFYKDLGGNLGFLAGFAYEVIPPWTVISIGSIMNFSGYFLVWLSVTNRIPNPHLWQMCIYICLATHAASYPNTAALVACVNNFPENRGSVIGLLKGLIGLSGAILTQIYHAGTNGVASGSSTAIILLIAWLPAIVPLLFSPVVRAAKFDRQEQENKEIQVLYRFLYFAIGLAGFIMFVIVFQNRFEFNRAEYIGTASVVVQLESCFKNIFNRPDRGEDYSILQAICSVDMAIIFVATTCGVGGALAAIDNLGQIAESLGYKNRTISTFISLISIWNFLGRVLAGFASEILLTRYNFPRPVMLSAVVLLSCAGHILIAVGVPNSLYFASILSGFCLGAQLPLVSAIISEIFGLKHFATLYSVGSVSSPVGSLIFNVKVAGRMYDEEALRQLKGLGMVRGDGKELKCVGVRCFRTAFLVISAASFVGFLVSVVLVWRTKEFYRSDVYKKYRTESEEASATRPENEA